MQNRLRAQIISFRQPAAKDQLPRRLDLVHPAELRGAGSIMEQFRLGLGFLGDLDHRVGEGVKCILVFRLGWLDHQCFVDDEREVVRGRMEVVVHQALGDVQGAYIAVLESSFCNKLVHADAVKRDFVRVAQTSLYIVGI